MHKTGETVTVQFCVSDPDTAGLVDADSLPTGVLVLNGANNAATVTVANVSTGVYSASVTLPTITDGDELQIRIAATVATVTGGGVVWQGIGCTKRPADVAADVASALATAHGAGSWLTAAVPGTYAQTVTVTAGGVVRQGVTVQILDAADDTVIDTGTTNVSGVVVLRCNALSVKFAATKAGYTSYTSTATTVTGAAPRSITLTAIGTIPAPTVSGTVTGYGYCYAASTAVKSGALVYVRQVKEGAKKIYDNTTRTLTSDASGLVSCPLWADGSTYQVQRSGGAWSAEFAPSEDTVGGGIYLLPGFLGT